MRPWDGPWVITKKLSEVNFRISKTVKGRALVVHSDRLKPFFGDIDQSETRQLWDSLHQSPDSAYDLV